MLIAGAAWAWVEFLIWVWCMACGFDGATRPARIYLSMIAGGLGACGRAERGFAAQGGVANNWGFRWIVVGEVWLGVTRRGCAAGCPLWVVGCRIGAND